MAKQASLTDGRIQNVSIESRMEQSFLDYSMSVIVGRALPDVRDGLKPVQRRILYSMLESGLRPDRPYRKCASAVGEVMKKYHPHGDSAIYDALVRLAQDFSTREPLVDGHGNFGSIDGDPPAAMRYTEARLTPVAMALLEGITESTVDFGPNYDGYEEEPTVLPSRLPNLLVNGASGIAVGMATNIPPHNLGEVVAACVKLIRDPKTSLDQLIEIVPAPDLPTGARIVASDGIRQAYETGKGAVTVEAVATSEMRSGNLPRIIITEIPYQVNKANLLERIAKLVQDRKLPAIRDLRDESSRDGMRIVIELKRGEDPTAVLNKLYKSTELRTNFNVNLVALVDGTPKTLGLREALVHYVDYQRQVVSRRTIHRLTKAQDRSHILEGLLTALDFLDEVIDLIRASKDSAEAKSKIIKRFEFSDVQAQAILDMQLRRLARLERGQLEDEFQGLQETITELHAILDDEQRRDEVLIQELLDLSRLHATPRRTRIVARRADDSDQDLSSIQQADFEAQPVTVYVTRGGYLKPISQRRTSPKHSQPHDPVVAVVRCSTEDTLVLFDVDGGAFRVDVGDLAIVQPRQRGTHAGALLSTGPERPVAGAVKLEAGTTVLFVTAAGQVKRTAASEFETRQRALQAMKLKAGDQLVTVTSCGPGDHVLVATDAGAIIRFAADDIRVSGRTAGGVAGIAVSPKARVVALSVVMRGQDDAGEVMTIAASGHAKRTPLTEYPVKGRGGKGVTTGTDALLWAGVATDLHVMGEEPQVLRVVDVPQARRAAEGQKILEAPAGPLTSELVAATTE